MTRDAFASAIHSLVYLGILIGVGLSGLGWLIFWLCQHITIGGCNESMFRIRFNFV